MTAYAKYKAKVAVALRTYPVDQVITELRHEIGNIQNTLRTKLLQLSGNRTPYQAREAVRAAKECVSAIEKICKELEAKEISI